MNARDIMTTSVVTVTPETSIEEAARLMLDRRISGLPVISGDGMVVGIVTEGDLLRRTEVGTEHHRSTWYGLLFGPGRLAQDYARARARKVGEVMTTSMISAAPETPLSEVVRLMEAHRVKRLPVIERGRLVGIISRANLVGALAEFLAGQHDQALSDDEIRRAVLAEIDRQPWGPRESVTVKVSGGVVELDGAIIDERERVALRVAAENLPGVKSVVDHLVWVEPLSGAVIPEPS